MWSDWEKQSKLISESLILWIKECSCHLHIHRILKGKPENAKKSRDKEKKKGK